MSDTRHDDIEALLRRDFEGPVANEGFSERVMQQLPSRRGVRWPLWLGVALGMLAGCLALAATPLLRSGWQDWWAGSFSIAGASMWLTVLAASWLVLGWGLAESSE